MWRKLYDTLSVVPTKGINAHCRPSDDLLDAFEAGNKLRLPKSYREFSKTFGAGELGGHYRIAVPGYPIQTSALSLNIEEMNYRWHADDAKDARNGSQSVDFYTAMFYFCETTEGEAIGWNLAESTHSNELEYRIYIRMRSDKFVLLTDSFADFVTDICLGDGYDRVMTAHGYELESPTEVSATFVPAGCDPDLSKS